MIVFGEEFEFAQQVLVAQRMKGVVLVIGFPMVMHQPVMAMWKDAQGVHGFRAASGMHAVEGQISGASDVQPVQAAIHGRIRKRVLLAT